LLLYLALGSAGNPVFVSETRNLFKFKLNLLPMEDTDCFDLIQYRGGEKQLFEGCRVQGFELRFEREQNIKLKLDIHGEYAPVLYPYGDIIKRSGGELFNGDNAFFYINSKEHKNIYGLTISAKKEGGTKTEIWIRRVIDKGADIPKIIDKLVINAQLLCDKYEYRRYGAFSVKLKNLVLVADETSINSSDAVISPLRYYVSGAVSADVFSSCDEAIA
jgi:hypothetical protein